MGEQMLKPAAGVELVREMRIEDISRQIDESKRTVELAFSSDTPIDTWYGQQILVHDADAVRMDRLNDGGALLLNHSRDDQIGVVDRAWCDAGDGKCRAVVRFSESAKGEEIFRDVVAGIRRLVSVGARVLKTETTEQNDGKTELVRVSEWEPYEISIVSVPADPTVGVGRSLPGCNPSDQKTKDKKSCSNEISRSSAIRLPKTVVLALPVGLTVQAARFTSK